jgi:hypothetical protein
MLPMIVVNPLLMAPNVGVAARWAAGQVVRHGGVLRVAKGLPGAGRIVAHLREVPGAEGIGDVIKTIGGMIDTATKNQITQAQFNALAGLTKVAAAASVVNLGVSVAGFALVMHKLGKLQDQVSGLERLVNARLDGVDAKLDAISQQLVELRYVQACHGDMLGEALRHLQRLHTDRSLEHIAAMKAESELLSRDATPTPTRIESAERTFRTARHFFAMSLSTHGLRRDNPADWPELLLRYRAWCIAVVADVTLHRRVGRLADAAQIAKASAEMARGWVHGWGATLLPPAEYGGAWRFGHRRFAELPREVMHRLVRLQTGEMPQYVDPQELLASAQLSQNAPDLDEGWWRRELGIAEVLDFSEETTARLESLAAEMIWCAEQGLTWAEWEALPMPTEGTVALLMMEEGHR